MNIQRVEFPDSWLASVRETPHDGQRGQTLRCTASSTWISRISDIMRRGGSGRSSRDRRQVQVAAVGAFALSAEVAPVVSVVLAIAIAN